MYFYYRPNEVVQNNVHVVLLKLILKDNALANGRNLYNKYALNRN